MSRIDLSAFQHLRRPDPSVPKAYASIDWQGLHMHLEAVGPDGKLMHVDYEASYDEWQSVARDVVRAAAQRMADYWARQVLEPQLRTAVLVAQVERACGIYRSEEAKERIAEAVRAYRELEPQADDDELVRVLSEISASAWIDGRNCGKSLALAAHCQRTVGAA